MAQGRHLAQRARAPRPRVHARDLGPAGEELCSLRWGDLECFEGRWTACFIGKGNRPAEQELYAPAVEALLQEGIRAGAPE